MQMVLSQAERWSTRRNDGSLLGGDPGEIKTALPGRAAAVLVLISLSAMQLTSILATLV